jgi:hypothetical protein
MEAFFSIFTEVLFLFGGKFHLHPQQVALRCIRHRTGMAFGGLCRICNYSTSQTHTRRTNGGSLRKGGHQIHGLYQRHTFDP